MKTQEEVTRIGNPRKPEGTEGEEMLERMNQSHYEVTGWALSYWEIQEDDRVLDIGCGSGILSIASLLLGAKSAFGVDIDSLAVKTAQANALENGFDESKFKAVQGNLSDKVSGKYNVVVANIVADIIMEFNKEVGKYLENDGVYITGGIIESREDEVLLSFAQNGFEVKERFEEKGWLVFVVKKSK